MIYFNLSFFIKNFFGPILFSIPNHFESISKINKFYHILRKQSRSQNIVYFKRSFRLKIRVNEIRSNAGAKNSFAFDGKVLERWKRKETSSVFSDFFLASGGIKAEQTSAPLSCVYRGFLDYRCNRRPPPRVFVGSFSRRKCEKVLGKSTFRLEDEKFTVDEISVRNVAESMMNSIRY